jgi:MFS family permease
MSFRALRHLDFRLLWIGLAVSIGTWMQIVAQGLLVLKITHGSAFALGCVSLAQALAFLFFALVGGTVADRVDKRRLLLFTQSGSAALAILFGFLTLSGGIRLWMVLALAFLNGTLLSFDQPTRGVLLPVLVPKEDHGNAISLQSMIFNGASTIGPALAGFGVAAFGYAGNFFLNAASFVGVLAALYAMRVPQTVSDGASVVDAIQSALATVRCDAVLPWALTGYATLLFLGPSSALILPVYAVKILTLDPSILDFCFRPPGLGPSQARCFWLR